MSTLYAFLSLVLWVNFSFLLYFSSCLQLINTDFCLCSFIYLTRGSGKAFSSAVLWNGLYPISCFISFIFKSWLMLPFCKYSGTFKLTFCTVLVPIPLVLQFAGVDSSLPTSSWAEKPHWPRAGHMERACLTACGHPVSLLSVALEPLDLLSWSGRYLCITSSTDVLNGKMFCLRGKKS